MDFSDALRIMRAGGIVIRQAWNGTGLTIGVMAPPAETGLTPFLALKAPNGQIMPWAPSHQELFAEDWFHVQSDGVAGHG